MPTPSAPAQAFGATESDEYSRPGWSWGGFFLGPLFLAGIRGYAYLLLILLFFIPFLGPLVMLAINIFVGIKGREMAASSSLFATRDQYIGFMRGVDKIGIASFIAFLAVLAVSFVFAGFIVGSLASMGRQ